MSRHKSAKEVEDEYLEVMGPELGALFHALYLELVWVHWRWKQFRILFGDKPSRIDLLNASAPFFFRGGARPVTDATAGPTPVPPPEIFIR